VALLRLPDIYHRFAYVTTPKMTLDESNVMI
jgi:hypothetical protein